MHEIRRIDPSRAARLLAIIYAVMFACLTLFMVPALLLAPPDPSEEGAPSKIIFIVMMILYPLFGSLMGWLTGQISCRVYNWAARKYGGLLIEAGQVQASTP